MSNNIPNQPKFNAIPTTTQIRSSFIDYFVKNGHVHVPASPLVPQNDPTLMFTNSGMVQFKDVFTGLEKRAYNRATSSQKSVRAGGKHNDLDNVGYTARHHTFFEMLGNFSFGDYFKEEAIYYAWELLTKVFMLPKEKLYITVFHNDDEAANFWKKIAGLSDDRIIKIATNDNFWSMGDAGPCGPCSEIFYDHGDRVFGGLPGTKDADGDRYIEIWNLVFMQFEQVSKDVRIDLPKKSVDTGMGLERVAAVMQGVHDNYDIDLFRDIIGEAESVLRVKAEGEALFSYRVIADHLRSSAFLIADGVMPSNEGRGYVLRRIMRRAMRHAHQLGSSEPLMYKLLPKLVDLFGNVFPEVKRAESFVSNILKQEEERFKTTLDRGLKLLDEETSGFDEESLKTNPVLSGEVAFKLYDTYGFPLDLTEDILKKRHIKVDIEGFSKLMDQQKERARNAWAGSGASKTDSIWFDILTEFGSTEFLGYSLEVSEGKILAIIEDGKKVRQISEKNKQFIVITNQTPFYGESGGQMGDVGFITSKHGSIKVLDTLKYLGKIHGHICQIEQGLVTESDEVKLVVDVKRRKSLKMHHSATHILHAVLRDVLGKHITQKGSLVAADRLRFDISHPNSLTKAEINLIEDKVNQIILDNSAVRTKLMSVDAAMESGAMALFGEKYDDEVRVVSMGLEDDEESSDNPYSFELCGGTHVSRTGDIGAFKIISEGAIAAGVRRIEAVCGPYCLAFVRDNESLLASIMEVLKSNKQDVLGKLDAFLQNKKDLEKELEKIQLGRLGLTPDEIAKQAIILEDGVRLLYREVGDVDPKLMRNSLQNIIKNVDKLILIYVSKLGGKVSLLVGVSKDIIPEYSASKMVKKISSFIGSSGGGSDDLAQAGSGSLDKLPLLKDEFIRLIKNKDF